MILAASVPPDWETLSLAQQVAQLIVVRASGHLFDQQILYPDWEPPAAKLRHWVQDLGVGGVILLGGSAAEVALKTQQLQDWATIPLLLCADIEEGVGQRFAGATWFPPPLAIGAIARHNLPQAIAYAEQMGEITAQEALAIGINWVLAPVVDVNNNPNNPVINVRSWGETPELVSQLAIAFLRGIQRHPALSAAKHFPGHGDTDTDSHLELPVIRHDRDRLAQVELPPFAAAIAQGVDAVMSAHLQIPALDADPATFSHAILTGELRQRMGFAGLIVTDALVMGAITQRYGANEAPVLAIEAGADVLMMPVDPEGAIQAICAAVESGRIPIDRIHASLERIWQAKRKVSGLNLQASPHVWEQVSPPVDLTPLAQPGAIASAAAILTDSLQAYFPAAHLRSKPDLAKPSRNLILVDDLLNSPFLSRQAPAIALPRERGYDLQLVDRQTLHLPDALPDGFRSLPIAATLLQLFVRSTPFRGTAGLTPVAWDWLNFLIQTEQLQAVVLYGSPYVLDSLLPHLPAAVPYVFTYGQMPAAQAIALKALFEQDELKNEREVGAGDRVFTD